MNNDKYLAKTDIDNLETDDVGSQTKKVSLYAFDSDTLEKKRLTGKEINGDFHIKTIEGIDYDEQDIDLSDENNITIAYKKNDTTILTETIVIDGDNITITKS